MNAESLHTPEIIATMQILLTYRIYPGLEEVSA